MENKPTESSPEQTSTGPSRQQSYAPTEQYPQAREHPADPDFVPTVVLTPEVATQAFGDADYDTRSLPDARDFQQVTSTQTRIGDGAPADRVVALEVAVQGQPSRILVPHAGMAFGRSADCEIRVPRRTEFAAVSRQAGYVRAARADSIEVWVSNRNGAFLEVQGDVREIKAESRVVLESGDTLRFGEPPILTLTAH